MTKLQQRRLQRNQQRHPSLSWKGDLGTGSRYGLPGCCASAARTAASSAAKGSSVTPSRGGTTWGYVRERPEACVGVQSVAPQLPRRRQSHCHAQRNDLQPSSNTPHRPPPHTLTSSASNSSGSRLCVASRRVAVKLGSGGPMPSAVQPRAGGTRMRRRPPWRMPRRPADTAAGTARGSPSLCVLFGFTFYNIDAIGPSGLQAPLLGSIGQGEMRCSLSKTQNILKYPTQVSTPT